MEDFGLPGHHHYLSPKNTNLPPQGPYPGLPLTKCPQQNLILYTGLMAHNLIIPRVTPHSMFCIHYVHLQCEEAI